MNHAIVSLEGVGGCSIDGHGDEKQTMRTLGHELLSRNNFTAKIVNHKPQTLGCSEYPLL